MLKYICVYVLIKKYFCRGPAQDESSQMWYWGGEVMLPHMWIGRDIQSQRCPQKSQFYFFKAIICEIKSEEMFSLIPCHNFELQ